MTTSEELEQKVNSAVESAVNRFEAGGSRYWNIIAAFQIKLDGKDWRIIGGYDTGGHGSYEKCELCGHFPCREIFIISDGVNEKHIGNECVKNFNREIAGTIDNYFKLTARRVAAVKANKPLLLRMAIWANTYGASRSLNFWSGQILQGKSLSKADKVEIEGIISKIPDAKAIESYNCAKDLISRARQRVTNTWERDFIESVATQNSLNRPLSSKQLSILERIANYELKAVSSS